MTYDYAKFWPGGTDKTKYPVKGHTYACFMTVENDLLNTLTNKVGTPYSGVSLNGLVAMRYTRHVKLACPENAGFIQQAVVNGNPAQLNLKKPMVVVANFSEPFTVPNRVAGTGDAYDRVDEENPVVKEMDTD